jgi:hypothetical protein
MNGRCIYCGHEGKMSREDYLPRCLGKFRGYELLSDRICKACNNGFSEIDEQFCRSGPEAIIRDMLGIEGRKTHKKISPFQRGSAGASRLTFKTRASENASGIEEVELDVDRSTRSARRLRQMLFIAGERRVALRITDDMKEPEQLREKIKEHKELQAMLAECQEGDVVTGLITGATQEEREWMERLLEALKDSMLDEPEFRIGGPEQEAKFTISASPTEKYFRGLAKIGFHYFLKHISGFHGSEDAFTEIREFITNGKAEDVDRFVSGRVSHLIIDIVPGESPIGYRHVLIARANYAQLQCKLQFFIHPKYSTPIYRLDRYALPIYTINLGRNPSRIDYPRACRHYFTYLDSYKHEGYDGVMREERVRVS